MAFQAYAVKILKSTNWHPLASTRYFHRDRLFRGKDAKKKATAFERRWLREYRAWRKAKGYDKNGNLDHCFITPMVVAA